jgi:hypothetical protein
MHPLGTPLSKMDGHIKIDLTERGSGKVSAWYLVKNEWNFSIFVLGERNI